MRWFGDDVPGLLEPEHRQARQHPALVGDRRRVNRVVGRDAVARDHQQPAAGPFPHRPASTSRGPSRWRSRGGRRGSSRDAMLTAAAGGAAARRSGDLVEPARRSRSTYADVVAVVEDRVRSRPAARSSAASSSRSGMPCPRRAGPAPGRPGRHRRAPIRARRARAARAGRRARHGSARGWRSIRSRSTVMPSTSAIARCWR